MMIHKISPLSKSFFGLAFVTASVILSSCSNSEISSSDIPEISQAIFVVPEGYSYEPYKQHAPSSIFYVDVNEKVRVWGIYAINDDFIPTDQSTDLYSSHRLVLDDKESGASYIYCSFDSPGVHDVYFETIDHVGDTLRSYANIYVGSPTSILLQSPANGYNQVDGKNPNGLELSWQIYGVDSWESSTCRLFASYNVLELWESPLGVVDCTNPVELIGELDPDYNENGKKIDHSTENSTIYWGIQVIVKNESGNEERIRSDVFNFSTKLRNNGKAIIEVPIVSQFSQYPEKSKLTGAFISASGDTLSKITATNTNSIIQRTLQPQSNLKIVVCDTIRTEFGCSFMTVDLAPSTKTITDTLFLQDVVKPNMLPVSTEILTNDNIRFYILDNGTGVNASKISAIMGRDTLQTNFEDNTLSIPNTCKSECNLYIIAEDYARNKTPDVYWKVSVQGKESYITGPFTKIGGEK